MPNDTNIRIAAYSVPLVFVTGFLLPIAFLLALAVLIFALFDAVLLVIALLVHFATSGHQSRLPVQPTNVRKWSHRLLDADHFECKRPHYEKANVRSRRISDL
jgi:hypothetical protein